jgi:DNA helicase HerA-like ATPase
MYAAFLLWLLTNLFSSSEEVGDLPKPKLVFFFDEAHLLFNGMPAYRLKRITQIVKLIRSRGIGLYFISQSPTDIPDEVLAQLGNRVQHSLRAYTPAEQKSVKAAANAFRTNSAFDTEEAILNLGTGEALISFQNEKGAPEIVERATVLPPQSKMGAIDDLSRNKVINMSSLAGKYDEVEDPESAAEIIAQKAETKAAEELAEKEQKIAEENARREAIAASRKRSARVARTTRAPRQAVARKPKVLYPKSRKLTK